MMLEAKGSGDENEKVKQVVRAVLVTTDGEVCIGRGGPGYEVGKWCLVGGGAESSALGAEVYREIVEETGVSIQDLTDEELPILIATIVRYKHGAAWHNNYFVIEMNDAAIPMVLARFNREEFSEVRFVTAEGVKGLRFAFGDGEIVRSFFKEVGN